METVLLIVLGSVLLGLGGLMTFPDPWLALLPAAAFAGRDNATGRGVAVLSNTARSVDAFAVELLRG